MHIISVGHEQSAMHELSHHPPIWSDVQVQLSKSSWFALHVSCVKHPTHACEHGAVHHSDVVVLPCQSVHDSLLHVQLFVVQELLSEHIQQLSELQDAK